MVTQYANQPSAAASGGAEPVKTGMTGEEAWLLFAKVSFGDYIDVGDRCWRRNVSETILRCC